MIDRVGQVWMSVPNRRLTGPFLVIQSEDAGDGTVHAVIRLDRGDVRSAYERAGHSWDEDAELLMSRLA